MPIATASGFYYPTEMEMELNHPIERTPRMDPQPIQDYQLDPVLPGEKAGSTDYDDSPTSEALVREGNFKYQDLKREEKRMENDLQNTQVDDRPEDQSHQITDRSDRKAYTPLTPEEFKKYRWDTPVVSSKFRDLYTKQDILDMLDTTQEEHDKNYKDTNEALKGMGKVLGDPLPAGRITVREDIPAVQELLKDLPDDIDVHDAGDGYIFLIKKGDKPPLTSMDDSSPDPIRAGQQEANYKGKIPGVEIREGSGGGYKAPPPAANTNRTTKETIKHNEEVIQKLTRGKSEDLGFGGMTKDEVEYSWAVLKQNLERKASAADKLIKELDKIFGPKLVPPSK